MDRQWLLSAAEKVDQLLARSSRAVFSSLRQESVVRPVFMPSIPAALQLVSTLSVGTPSVATVTRLVARASAAKGIMTGILVGAAVGVITIITRICRPGFLDAGPCASRA